MKNLLILLLLVSNLSYGQCTFSPAASYKNYEPVHYSHSSESLFKEYLEEHPFSDKEVFGTLDVVFRFDKTFKVYDLELISFVHPWYDSLLVSYIRQHTREITAGLVPDTLYGFSVRVGSQKNLGRISGAMMLSADGNDLKAEAELRKCLKKSPQNSEVIFALGKSLIRNNKEPEGLDLVMKAVAMGDVKAIKYLEEHHL